MTGGDKSGPNSPFKSDKNYILCHVRRVVGKNAEDGEANSLGELNEVNRPAASNIPNKLKVPTNTNEGY